MLNKPWLRFIFCVLSISLPCWCEPITDRQAIEIAERFLDRLNERWYDKGQDIPDTYIKAGLMEKPEIYSVQEFKREPVGVLAYVVNIRPVGYILVSPDLSYGTILGYSLESNIDNSLNGNSPLASIITGDIQAREKYTDEKSITIADITQNKLTPSAQAYPDEDGWLETAWDQHKPFNDKCPTVEPNTPSGTRRLAGCTSIATAQVVNFFNFPPSMSFSDRDIYWSFPLLSTLTIDADANKYDFPNFSTLNTMLSSIVYGESTEAIQLRPYLIFGIGVKIQTAYGKKSSASITGYVKNALLNDFS